MSLLIYLARLCRNITNRAENFVERLFKANRVNALPKLMIEEIKDNQFIEAVSDLRLNHNPALMFDGVPEAPHTRSP